MSRNCGSIVGSEVSGTQRYAQIFRYRGIHLVRISPSGWLASTYLLSPPLLHILPHHTSRYDSSTSLNFYYSKIRGGEGVVIIYIDRNIHKQVVKGGEDVEINCQYLVIG